MFGTFFSVIDVTGDDFTPAQLMVNVHVHQLDQSGSTEGVISSQNIYMSPKEAEELIYELQGVLAHMKTNR